MYFRALFGVLFLMTAASGLRADPSVPPTGAPDPAPSTEGPPQDAPAPEPASPAAPQLAQLPYIHPKSIPATYCEASCTPAADKERVSAGPEPASPNYRLSMKQSAAARNAIIQSNRANGHSKKDDALTFERVELVSLWKDAWPKGSYQETDLADVLAKYWIYSWAIGGGADLSAITDQIQTSVRNQFHALAATDEGISKLTEAQRQALAEHLMRMQSARWTGMMMVAKYHDELAKMMKGAGTDFDQEFGYDVTSLGIVPGTGFAIVVKR